MLETVGVMEERRMVFRAVFARIIVCFAILASFATCVGVGNVSAATQVIFDEDFESSWPGSWAIGDEDAASGYDYWGVTTYRSHQGSYSAWCAQVGSNSGNGQPNSALHYYDTDMGAYMEIALVGISGYDSVTLSFYYWAVTGTFSLADYLAVWAWTGSAWTQLWTQPDVTSSGWQLVSVGIPLTATYLNFYFVSDPTVGWGPYEGAYVDEIVISASDSVPPTSWATSLPSYRSTSSFSASYVATDSGSGVNYVELYYRLGPSGSFTKYVTSGNPTGHWTTSPIVFDTTQTGGNGLYQFYTRATDMFGNVEPAPASPDASTIVDTIAPSTLHSILGTAGTNGWYVSSVTVTLVAGDTTSGVASTEYRIDSGSWLPYTSSFVYSTEGSHLLEYYSADNAGNLESIKGADLNVDTSDPISTIAVTGVAGEIGWFVGASVDVNFTAVDDTSGIAAIFFSMNGGNWQSYLNEFQANQEGTTIIEYYATDLAGNSESPRSYSFRLDTVDPVTQIQISGTEGNDLWYVTPVDVALDPADNMSGINWTMYRIDGGPWQVYSGPFSIDADGIHTIEFYSQDNASRTEATHNVTAKLDTGTPLLTLDLQNNTKFTSDTVVLTWSPSDSVSGVNRTEYSLDGGAFQICAGGALELKGLADGDHDVVLRVTDNAGNTVTRNVSFTVNTNLFSLSGPVGPWLDVGLILIALAAVLALVFLMRRRKKAKPSQSSTDKNGTA